MALFTVVLPIFNVEEYLQECLRSLAQQTMGDIEVIMVDDGSTDNSAAIADAFAESDSRFTLVRQDNHGLGHARNTGIRHATGEFITFIDSDDVIPHYAFRSVVNTLRHTGSDFLTGKVVRIDTRGAFESPMHRTAFARTRLRTNVAECPDLMRDLLAADKVYRTDFWDAAGLSFPEGVLFEDGPVSVRAHASAKSVDVVSLPIYYWRLRDGLTRSLSQQSDDSRFFVDRIHTSTITVDFLAEHRPELLPSFFAMDIRHKFQIMFRALPYASAEIQQMFMASAVPHLRQVPENVVDALPKALARQVRLTRSGDVEGLLETLMKGRETVGSSGDRGAGATVRRVLRKSSLLRTGYVYLRKRRSSAVRSAVTAVSVEGDALRICGYGYVPGLPVDGPVTAANRVIWARHQETRRAVWLSMRSRPSAVATAEARDGAWSYRRSGFEAVLSLRRLRNSSGDWMLGTWVCAMGSVTFRGLHRSGLRMGFESSRADPRPLQVDRDTRIVPLNQHGVLAFRVERTAAVLRECERSGAELLLRGVVSGEHCGEGTVRLCRVDDVSEYAVPASFEPGDSGESSFTARIPLSGLAGTLLPVAAVPVAGVHDRLQFHLDTPGNGTHLLACDPGHGGATASAFGHHLTVQPSTEGDAVLTIRRAGPVVERAGWDDAGRLVVSGSGAQHVVDPRLVCRHTGRKEERVFPVALTGGGTWSVTVDPSRVRYVGGVSALRAGVWRLVLRSTDQGGVTTDADLPYHPGVFAPVESNRIPYRDQFRLERLGSDALALRVQPRLRPEDRGGYHQRLLREGFYPDARASLPLRHAVLYDSFTGKQFSDSPRALYEELRARGTQVEHIWVNRDGQAPIPDEIDSVETGSREWFEALATCRYVVANTHLPPWFRRREGQVVAQLWHGIGFKRVGFDIESVQFANKRYLQKLAKETPNWSFLVSPSAFCTPILRRAFRYYGEICEIGSPRNDLLISGDRDTVTRQVRNALGLPAGKKILLYAPTWRDNEYHGPGRYKFNLQLDVARFPQRLRDEYVLLVRRHPNTVDDLLGERNDFVWDVANYPDTRDLLVAADVLISDYSTIALDFANTGRPILFYTYDLENYRDRLRGFYFDLEAEGPGPVLATTAGVVDALLHLDSVVAGYRQRYEAFQETFCAAEDGMATSRLIDRLFRDA